MNLDILFALREMGKDKMDINGVNRFRGFEPVKNAPEDTVLPILGTEKSAGYDFVAPIDFVVPANDFSDLINLNIKAYMQDDEYLGIVIRSSLATKHKLVVAQGEAIIDADYYGNVTNDGNIGIMLYNRGKTDYQVKKGDRIVQGIFKSKLKADNIKPLGKRIGGYGSSGK